MTRTPPPPPTDKAKAALAKYRDGVSADKRRDIEKAINYLRKTKATINVSTVARRAKVQRKTVLKHDDLMVIINQYRNRPPASCDHPPATSRESSIMTALRRKIATQETEISELKTTVAQQQATIELLYGQLEDRRYGNPAH
ncbi:transposase [Mycobacteroides abscessus subsp. abscessus]|uniref:transposase n=1 Tax=Mycobacteroides abscessus TaxID=36809 RepID=UPI00266DD627|nr:transposase [Mycobacteroides abscessus]MDO3013289.1 transposase [Mycobacteroides abscessus subsp. abscessus]